MTITTTETGPGIFTIGAADALTNFQTQVTNIVLSCSTKVDDPVTVLSGEKKSGDRVETWTLKGKMLNDFGALDGRQEWLFTNRGKDLPFEFQPLASYNKSFTGTLTVEAIEIGGDAGKSGDHDFEFTLVGSPILGPKPANP